MLKITIATLAPIVNCIQLFPQLYKTYTTKSVHDLSIISLLLFLTTNILWMTHGIFINDLSLIIAGLISLIINTSLIILYLYYNHHTEKIIYTNL
jgi:uncharacterized protein with PQ loop repeat